MRTLPVACCLPQKHFEEKLQGRRPPGIAPENVHPKIKVRSIK